MSVSLLLCAFLSRHAWKAVGVLLSQGRGQFLCHFLDNLILTGGLILNSGYLQTPLSENQMGQMLREPQSVLGYKKVSGFCVIAPLVYWVLKGFRPHFSCSFLSSPWLLKEPRLLVSLGSLFPKGPLFTSVVGLCMTLKGLNLSHFNFLKVQQGRQQVLRDERDSVCVPGLSQCPYYLMVVTKKDSSYNLPKTYSVFPKHGPQMVKLLPQTIKIATIVSLTNCV